MRRGFPRPKAFVEKTSRSPYRKHRGGNYGKKWNNRYYPWPYTASDDKISNISRARLKESVYFKKCGTCGEPVEEEMVGLIVYNTRSRKLGPMVDKGTLLHSESGPYHLKCLALNFVSCPHLAATNLYEPAYGKWSDVRQQIIDTIS